MSTTHYVKQFKQTIMDRFREVNADIGHVLPQAWLTTYFPESIKQKVVFEQAMQQLQDENLIEYQLIEEDHHHIMLTQQGEDYLYPNFSVTDAKEKIQNSILTEFKISQNKTITLRWLNTACFNKFNPKEQRIFNNVIENMLTEQLMITSPTGLQFYLTEKGEKLMGERIV